MWQEQRVREKVAQDVPGKADEGQGAAYFKYSESHVACSPGLMWSNT